MPAQRIKGQEVSIIIVRDGQFEDTLTDVRNFNAEIMLEIKSEGYLGEKTNRKDDVYRGVKFDLELHIHTQDLFRFANAILERTKRNTPDVIFNISGVFSFPNGETPTFLISDAKFGPIPIGVPERGDYVSVKLEGEADEFTVQFS